MKGIEVCVYTRFARAWNILDSNKLMSALSRIGYVIKIANYLTYWVRKMQMKVVLSTMEAEYIALSQSIRDLISIKNILEYLNKFIKLNNRQISTFSTIFKDNAGTLQLANEPKYHLDTKYTYIKYYHFHQYVRDKTITIRAIDANN